MVEAKIWELRAEKIRNRSEGVQMMRVSEVQELIQVHKRGSVKIKVREEGELREKTVEYRQTNQIIWQIRRSHQGGWKDFANELTSEKTVRELIRKEYNIRY